MRRASTVARSYGLIFLGVNIVLLVVLLFVILDRGRIDQPGVRSRLDARELARLRGGHARRARSCSQPEAGRLMAIGVKVRRAPDRETSYVRATLKGMAHTLKHLIDPHKVTTQYPEEK